MSQRVFKYGEVVLKEKDRNTIFIEKAGYPHGDFTKLVREYGNGLINGDGGVMFFGINKNGIVKGIPVNRSDEDDYRLATDRCIGSFIPFVAPVKYRIIFHVCEGASRFRPFKVIQLKISSGSVGELYEDGLMKAYLFTRDELLGPLLPQEIKELVLFKYQESLKQLKSLQKFATPFAEKKAKKRKSHKED